MVPSVSLSQIGPIEAQLLNDGVDHVGELITITDAIPVSATHCGFTWADYACEVSDPSGPIDTTCSIQDTLFVVVGDQFEINTQTLELCVSHWFLTLTPLPGNNECVLSGKIQICHMPPGNPNIRWSATEG